MGPGYDVTARFLEHCDRFRPGFVAALNRKVRDKWRLDYFVELVGKKLILFGERVRNIGENVNLNLRKEYKDKYRGVKARTGCQISSGKEWVK